MIATIVIGLLLFTAVALVIRGILRNKKNGTSSCSCGGSCNGCCGSCHR